MSHLPKKPARITLETLPALFAYNRAVYGGHQMMADSVDPPADPPEGISSEEWEALGDPGKQAIVRERQRAQKAEADLAAERARVGAKTPPKPGPPKSPPASSNDGDSRSGDEPDFAALIKQAVDAAVAPLHQAEQDRQTREAAQRIVSAVEKAAAGVLHDPTDATSGIDLTAVVDDNGNPDAAKITEQINDLLTRKPHLGRPSFGGRFGVQDGSLGGGHPGGQSEADRVKALVAEMQSSTGIKVPAQQ